MSRDRATEARAVGLLLAGVTLFAISDGLSKFLTESCSIVQVVWARYAFAVPVVLASAEIGKWRGLFRSGRPALQVGRGLLLALTNIVAVVGLGLLPLADFTAINFVSPLLVVAFAVPLLGERVSAHGWISVAVGFAGILVIVRPGAGTIAWAALFPLVTALLYALFQVLTPLVSRWDSPVVTLAWTIAVGLGVATLLLPFHWRPIAGVDWLLMALAGLIFGAAHGLLIRAFMGAPASLLAPFTYVQIFAAVIFGVAVFGHVPDLWTVVGMALITLAGIYVLRRQATSP